MILLSFLVIQNYVKVIRRNFFDKLYVSFIASAGEKKPKKETPNVKPKFFVAFKI